MVVAPEDICAWQVDGWVGVLRVSCSLTIAHELSGSHLEGSNRLSR